MNINKDDYSPEVYQIILEAGKKEKIRKKIMILCWALVLLALVMLFGGYSFIREQVAPYESPLIEHKILSYIDIMDEERMPPELVDTLCAEYVPEDLQELLDEPSELGVTDMNERETEASKELKEKFRSMPDRTGINLNSRHIFYYFSRNEHSINVTIRKMSYSTSAEWAVGYFYYDDGSISKSLNICNERIRLIASNIEGKIKIKYDPSLGLPSREISLSDYRNYMEARRTGKVSKHQLLSITKMQEYAKMSPGQ